MKEGVLEKELFVRFVIYNRFQIEIKQTGVGIGILVIQKDEAILLIKRYRHTQMQAVFYVAAPC